MSPASLMLEAVLLTSPGSVPKVGDSDDLTSIVQIPGNISASHARGGRRG